MLILFGDLEMEWTLGVTGWFQFISAVGSWLIVTLFVSILLYLPILYVLGSSEKKANLATVLSFVSSAVLVYLLFAYVSTFEINNHQYNYIYEVIEPHKEDSVLKSLLNDARKDGQISSAERDRLLHRVKQIQATQEKEELIKAGRYAKNQLINE